MSAFPFVDNSHYGYEKHAEHKDVAFALNRLLDGQIEKAMAKVSELLGVDAFTRELDDYKPAYGFVVPEVLFNDNRDQCDALLAYVRTVFKTHYVSIVKFEWREPTTYKDVDCWGSRSRDIAVPHHCYLEFGIGAVGTRRPPLDYCEMEKFPLTWDQTMDTDDQYHYYIRIRTVDGDVGPWKATDGTVVAEPGNTKWDARHCDADCDCDDSGCDSE